MIAESLKKLIYSVYPKYLQTLTPLHTYRKIQASPFDNLVMNLKICAME